MVVVGIGTALLSVAELMFISFLGGIVDWLATADRETFLDERGGGLIAMAALVVIAYPLVVFLQSLVHYQTIFGNHPMLVRWITHRYMLGQSLAFFQGEFAGRVATKVMQTAQAVRDVMDKLIDVFVYVVVYFIGALILVAQADPILTLPLFGWLIGYLGILFFFVPRMKTISMAQANAAPSSPAASSTATPTSRRSNSSPIRSARRSMRARRWTSSWAPSGRCFA